MGKRHKAGSVLFVETDDWAFAKHRIALARRLRSAGYEVAVAAPSGEWGDRIAEEGFAFHAIPLDRSGTNPFREIKTVLALIALYRRCRPRLVHHIALKAILYGRIAALFAQVEAVVNYVTGLGYLFTANDGRRRMIRFAITPLLAFAFRGRRVINIFENWDDLHRLVETHIAPRSRSRVGRGSGVDVKKFAPSPMPGGPLRVLLASRLLLDKGVVEMVEAIHLLQGTGLEVKGVLAGAPDPANPSSVPADTVRSWQDQGLIDWLGYVEDMPAVYADAHIVCLPSYREGLPVSLLEAAASARPIVTTDVAGCRDVVVHGETGLLVPPRDAEAVGEAIAQLANDRELMVRMGHAGRRRVVKNHSNDVALSFIVDLYSELLGDMSRTDGDALGHYVARAVKESS